MRIFKRNSRRGDAGRAFTAAAAAATAVTLGVAATPRSAQAQNLIQNGDFEFGSVAGWQTADILSADVYNPGDTVRGGFSVQTTTTAPFTSLPTLGPAAGSFFALDDATAPGEHALYQIFTTPANAINYTLTFSLYNYDWAGAGGAVDPSGLDFTAGDSGSPNQHVRVDLLMGDIAGNPFSISPSLLVQTLYGPGVDPEAAAGSAPYYRTYTASLTAGDLAPGGTYALRFAEVDNEAPLSVGVDDVSLRVTGVTGGAAAPEPGTIALILATLAGAAPLTVRRWRRRPYTVV